MGRKKKESISLTDIAAAWKAGWTPTEVNALLDRVDAMGDINSPDPAEKDDEDEDIDIDASGEDEPDEDEDIDASAEDDEDDEESEEDDTKSSKRKSNSQDNSKNNLLEVENKRLKKQIQKLQMKNRSKDLSGDENKKTPEQSLIDTIQSLFD